MEFNLKNNNDQKKQLSQINPVTISYNVLVPTIVVILTLSMLYYYPITYNAYARSNQPPCGEATPGNVSPGIVTGTTSTGGSALGGSATSGACDTSKGGSAIGGSAGGSGSCYNGIAIPGGPLRKSTLGGSATGGIVIPVRGVVL